jgi:putative PIN family toxin of toxin-antitoxin system
LDINVVVAAFAARGLCESVFELCLEKHEMVVSEFLLEELREKLSKKIKLPHDTIADIMELYSKHSERVVPVGIEEEICRDPEDIPVLGTCLSGGAEYLISGDKDLLVLKQFRNIKILTPREFYELH